MRKLFKRKKVISEISFLRKVFVISCAILFVPPSLLHGQDLIAIKGVVTESSSEALPGVTIIIKGTNQGTVTDFDGKYKIEVVSKETVLVFRSVGFVTEEVTVGDQTNIDVVLTPDIASLDEVVIVGYGKQKKVDLTGSISTVKSDKLTITPLSNTTNALTGLLPGLVSKQESGLPGRDGSILSIRGFGNALVIVDGVENDFDRIDANEIESISILKDASAAIYGSRAGNGVILVTTKRGTDKEPTITLNGSYTLQGNILPIIPMSSGQLTEIERETHLQSGKPEDTAPWTQEEIDLFYSETDPDFPNTNWFDELARDWTPQQQYNISVRGGNSKAKYYSFLGFLNQESMFKENGGDYKRYNFRTNLDVDILDNLSVQINFSSIIGERRFPNRKYEDGYIWQDLWNARAYYPAHLPDPTKIPYTGSSGVNAFTNSEISGYDNEDTHALNGSIALKYDFNPIEGLSAKAFFNYDYKNGMNKNYQKPFKYWIYNFSTDTYIEQGGINISQLWQTTRKDRIVNGQLSLNYDRTFNNDHHFTALALYEMTDYSSEWMNAVRSDFVSTDIDYLFAGSESTQLNGGAASQMGRASFIGRINYYYKNKYLLESTLRYDASAKFSPKERWGLFPSVSLGWRLSEENFIKDNLESVENLKLRLSYGQMGNDAVGNFQYLSGFSFGGDSRYVNYVIGSSTQKALLTTGLANPYLTWEKMNMYNLGLDISLWNRGLYGAFDVFYRERNGIPATRLTSIPSTFGAEYPQENLNSMNNRGFEAMVGHTGTARDLSWDINANISFTRAKWGHYEEPEYSDADEIRINKKSGEWVDRDFGYLSDGLFTSENEIATLGFDQDQQGNSTLQPGDVKYIDVNEDKILDWRDQVEIGNGTTPHWIMGLNSTLQYKNIDIAVLFQGGYGFNNYIVINGYPQVIYEKRWTEGNNNPNALIPRLGGNATNNNKFSDYRLKNSSYLRLKSLAIGYSIPQSVIAPMKITSLRFYFSATNLFTFDGLKEFGIDPEAPSGMSNFYYPQQRTLTFGLNLTL